VSRRNEELGWPKPANPTNLPALFDKPPCPTCANPLALLQFEPVIYWRALCRKWFDKDAVRCGLFPNSGAWKTRFGYQSPNYTTDWRQLMTAH
jgi:hypothetical protein